MPDSRQVLSFDFGIVPGRVEVHLGDPLAQALRPSRDVIDRIERLERANALAWNVVRNMPLGSDMTSRQPSPPPLNRETSKCQVK